MGRTGSTLILLVVALGLGGYLYFVESERPVADENAKTKVFGNSAKINQVQIKSSSGEVTALRKGASDTWTIVQPADAPADRNTVSDVVTNLANLEETACRGRECGRPEGVRPRRAPRRGDVPRRRRERAEADAPSGPEDARQLRDLRKAFIEQPGVPRELDGRDGRRQVDLRFPRQDGGLLDQTKVTSLELASGAQTIRLEKTGEEWKLESRYRRLQISSA